MSGEKDVGVNSHNRRMSRDYEFLPEAAEALVHVAMSRSMLKRLAQGIVSGLLRTL